MAVAQSNSINKNENFYLTWLDSSINHSLKNIEKQKQFRKIIKNFFSFQNEQQCFNFIESKSKNDRIILILNGILGQIFIPKINHFQQIISIYIYQQYHQLWTKQFSKIKGVFVHFTDLLHQIEINHISSHRSDQLLTIYILEDKSTSDLNGDFLHSQILIDCLLKMNMNSNDRNEFLTLCKQEYKEDIYELSLIDQFEREYSSKNALWWYTRDSFIYKMLNKALRIQNIHLLYLFRFLIYDIENEIKKTKCQTSVRVYRSQLMSKDEIQMLRNSLGDFISINSFFSTSMNYHRARSFVFNETNTNNNERVFFDIQADPHMENLKSFANISLLSYYPEEQEVLFMIGSIFRIINIHQDDEIIIIQMKLSSLTNYHLQGLIQHMKKKQTNLLDLANILTNMGKWNDAEKYYYRYLNEDFYQRKDFAEYYSGLGSLEKKKENYDLSLKYHQKSLEIKLGKSKPDRKSIANSFNRIGNVYEEKNEYENALESYKIALEIFEQINHDDQSSIAMCMNNIGVIYRKQKKYSQALDLYEKILIIWKKYLPINYNNLGSSHTNLALTYRCLSQYDLALLHLNLSLKIHQESRPSQHPSIASTLANIGLVYEDKNDYKQAIDYFEKALIIYQQSLSSTHSYVIDIKENIRRVLSKF